MTTGREAMEEMTFEENGGAAELIIGSTRSFYRCDRLDRTHLTAQLIRGGLVVVFYQFRITCAVGKSKSSGCAGH